MRIHPFLASLDSVSLLGAATALLLSSSVAQAATLGFQATLTVELPSLALLPAQLGSGAGSASVGPDGSFSLPAGAVQLSGSTAPQTDVRAEASGSSLTGGFAPNGIGGGGFGGAMPLSGTLRLIRTQNGTPLVTLATLSLRPIGFGGTAVAPGPLAPLTLIGGPWTTAFVGFTPPGATPFLSGSGQDARTPGGAGLLSLVSPVFVQLRSVPPVAQLGVARLDLVFTAPEALGLPWLAAALTSAGVGFGRARARRRSGGI